MKQFFNIDNFIFRGISKWMDYVYVSVLWFIFSIPLITMGAATAALYYTAGQCLRYDRGYIFKSFWSSFKNSFRQSTIVTVFFFILFGAIHLDMYLVRGQTAMKMLQTVFVAARLLILMVSVYIFPYISRYRQGMAALVKNCIWLCIVNFPWTIVLILILGAAYCMVSIVPAAVFIIPSCAGVFFSLILDRIFSRYSDNEGR
mgnify:FL=1|jgi:uncharacterized membrane protein YesL